MYILSVAIMTTPFFHGFVFTEFNLCRLGKKVVRELRTGTVFIADAEGNVARYQRVETPKSARKKQATQKSKAMAKKAFPKVAKTVSQVKPCTVRVERLTKSSIEKLQTIVKRQHQLRAVKANINAMPCKSLCPLRFFSRYLL